MGKAAIKKPFEAEIDQLQRQSSRHAVAGTLASSSSSPADTETDRVTSSDGWYHYLGTLSDGKVDNGKIRQQSPPKHRHSRSVDVQTTLDPSLVSEFDQRLSSQYTTFISNPSLEFPSFETFHCAQPEPVRSAIDTTSENIHSRSLSTGDVAVPYKLRSTTRFKNYSYSSIGSKDVGIPPEASSSASIAFPSSSSACRCLAAIVFAVEELETNYIYGKRAELDSIVACQKHAIACCRSLMRCGDCMAKRATVVLLVLMTEKIVTACECISLLFRVENDIASGDMGPKLATEYYSHCVDGNDSRLPANPAPDLFTIDYTQYSLSSASDVFDASNGWQELFFGDYEITCPREWEYLVRTLILIQLTSLMDMLADLKRAGGKLLGETQKANLSQATFRLGEIERAMRGV